MKKNRGLSWELNLESSLSAMHDIETNDDQQYSEELLSESGFCFEDECELASMSCDEFSGTDDSF